MFSRWIWRMAWRDTRFTRRQLALFTSSIVIGIASLVAIQTLRVNLLEAVDTQAKTLLGADLALNTRQEPTPEVEELLASIPGERAREVSFNSMAYFPRSQGTRLVQVRAVEGGFPFFGNLDTHPPEAARAYQDGALALVDETLLLQFEEAVGNSVRVGAVSFRISGGLRGIPGEVPTFSLIGPRLYIPLAYLEETRLIQPGSRVQYRFYYKLEPGTDVDQLLEGLSPRLEQAGMQVETVERRKASIGRPLRNLHRFLSLAAFVALLLGGVGVAGAIHVYMKQRLGVVAILRCLGATPRQTLAIFVVQAGALGLAGGLVGAAGGTAIQPLLPLVLGEFLPVEIPTSFSAAATLRGVGVGTGVALLFALIPLLSVRKVSPLLALRAEFEAGCRPERDPLKWLLYLILALSVLAFALAVLPERVYGLWFFAALVAVFGLLALLARGLVKLSRAVLPASWSYVWRQALANLYRPLNQTSVVMLSLGLSTFLMVTVYVTQSSVLEQVRMLGSGDKPNLVLFDIQSDQKEAVSRLVHSFGLPILQEVPIVTMRLASVKGRSVEEIQNDPENTIPRWALTREFRSTYRDRLIDSEELVAGEWRGRADHSSEEPVPVSLEEGLAERMDLALGDELVFDILGVPVRTAVASLRRVDWDRVQTNFFVVFPEGVLEPAPQFHAVVTRSDSPAVAAQLQRAMVREFPNVSAVDLAAILVTVDQILGKISLVVRFMALFSILTGLIILAAVILSGRYQRLRESVLLRTLGATRRQIRQILLMEYFLLGSLAALAGVLLALGAGWALARFVFEIAFAAPLVPLISVFLVVVTLTVLVGMANSRGVSTRSPLEVLRADSWA